MLTLACPDTRSTYDQRYFLWQQLDPNLRTYCNNAKQFIGCLDPPNSPQYAGDGIKVDAPNAKADGLELTCQGLINYKLNHAYDSNFANAIIDLGCPIYSNSDHTLYTKCSFSDDDGTRPTFSNCQIVPNTFDFNVRNCTFNWSCSVVTPDPSYRPLCCNARDISLFSGTDPLTGRDFTDNWAKHACAPDWCLSDPSGICRNEFLPCDSTASCGRHSFLTYNSPVATDDILLNTIQIVGATTNSKGIQCNSVYNEVVAQSFMIGSYSSLTGEGMIRQHILDVMDLVKKHCSSPITKGNGECACINGYNQANVGFATGFLSTTLLESYQDATIPTMVVQNAAGGYRRVDAYCEYGPEWINELSYSSNGTYTSFSNACADALFWSQSEYQRPTLNPIRSVFSLTNFGDLNVSPSGLSGPDGPSNAMPLHCWLPACVGTAANGQSNHLVFPDLMAFTKTCPSVCFMYSAGSDININNATGDSFINMGSNFQGCSFNDHGQGYPSEYNPFLLKKGCDALFITAPINFTGIINLLVSNPIHDNADNQQTRVVSAFSNIPQVSFYNGGQVSTEFVSQTIYKYDSEIVRGSSVFSSTANLQLYVNTSNTSAFTSFQSEIILYDGLYFFQSIPVQLYVYPDPIGSGGTSFTAQVCGNIARFDPTTGAIVCSQTCDCTFGASSLSQNCPEGPNQFTWPTRTLQSQELGGTSLLTTESLRAMGAAALLQSHISLYG
jgi:hypothetical protein